MKILKNRNPAVSGFKATGLCCGIKDKSIKDLALIVSEVPANAAAVFTKNQVVSPGVTWSRRAIAKSGSCRAVIVNSGNANAVTGPKGLKDCDAITKKVADELGIPQKEVFIASTGIIGVPLPSEKIIKATPNLIEKLGGKAKNWTDASEAIMTTDLVSKSDRISYSFNKGKRIVIGGITKGSGMIHPNMATMLGFLFTDATIDSKTLKMALTEAADRSFNRITVDGDNSTNDCVAILANGTAKNPTIKSGTPAYREFLKALTKLCKNLASKIVLDGEGATKFVTVRVQGGKTRKQAYLIANSVATSSLVKTALFGEDPNWGRIFCAVGNAGAPLKSNKVDILLNKNLLLKNGAPTNLPQKKLEKAMRPHEIDITIDLNCGKEWEEVLTCDLSYDYVKINAEYTT